MDEFFERLRRRKVVQWSLVYLAGAFALIQVLDIVAQRFEWPALTIRLLILVLAIGFFLTLVIAWYHGDRGAQQVTGAELLILALLITIGGAVVWRLAPGVSDSAAEKSTALDSKSAIKSATDRSQVDRCASVRESQRGKGKRIFRERHAGNDSDQARGDRRSQSDFAHINREIQKSS